MTTAYPPDRIHSSRTSGELIDVGRKAPVFSLPNQDGRAIQLKELIGRPVVLYFYPKDDTPGCTNEACGFRDAWPDIERTSALVLGISPDGIASHAAFAAKFKLPFQLLADAPGRNGVPKVADRYGVWQEKSMYGRTAMGVGRTTYLVDEAGKVARRWDRVKVDGHAQAVLEAIREIRSELPPRRG